jgi:cytochrome c-type biogenesis protein CcmH/NrfG
MTIPNYVAIGILILLALLALPRLLAGRLSEQIDPTRDQKAQQPQPDCEC